MAEKHAEKNKTNELIAILEMLPLHIYWMDIDNKICGCNKEQALAAGFLSPDEMVGKTDYDMPWHEFADKILAINKKVMREKITYTVEEEVFYLMANVLFTFPQKCHVMMRIIK